MGLTIQYELRAKTRSPQKVKELVERLRHKAMNLPFTYIGQVWELGGETCHFERYDPDDPLRWLANQAGQFVVQDDSNHRVVPDHVLAFGAWVGDGRKETNFGLAVYPRTIKVGTGTLPTGIEDWSWSTFYVTPYASDLEDGGVWDSLCYHLAVVRLLDHANELGILASVKDEGGFWDERNVDALARKIGRGGSQPPSN